MIPGKLIPLLALIWNTELSLNFSVHSSYLARVIGSMVVPNLGPYCEYWDTYLLLLAGYE